MRQEAHLRHARQGIRQARNEFKDARAHLEAWLALHPADPAVRMQLDAAQAGLALLALVLETLEEEK